jgi:glycosyltransferase involved in cell wall biosynthesis
VGAIPTISILIPVRDGAPHLRAALESALGQTRGDLEVVVIDDGSKDASAAILANYRMDARVKVLRHDRPRGAAATWNRLVDIASGNFALLLPQDDVLDPDAVEHRHEAINAQPGAVGVLARYRLIDARGRRFGPTMGGVRGTGNLRVVEAPELTLESARAGGNVAGPPVALLARRMALRSVRFREEAGYAIDLDLVIRLARIGDIIALPRADCCFRVHGSTWTHQLRRQQTADFVRLMREAGSSLPEGSSLPRFMGLRAASRTLLRRATYAASRAGMRLWPAR